MKQTQTSRLLAYLQAGHAITSDEAKQELGIARLASRIHDLKDSGFDITKETIIVPNRWGEDCHITKYSMATVKVGQTRELAI